MSNLDDFDTPPQDFESEEPDRVRRQSIGKGLTAAWQGSPVFKIFLLLVGGGAIASAALGVFNSDKPKDTKSVVQQGGTVSATPGGEAPPAFQEAVNEASAQRAQSAIQQGGSALPTPMGNTTQMTNLDPSQQGNDDPLAEFRAQQEKTDKAMAPQPAQAVQQNGNVPARQVNGQPVQATGEPPLDANLAQAMQQQMQSLVSSWTPTTSRVIKVSETTSQTQTGTGAGTGNGTGTGQDQQPFDFGKTLIQAGTINYGQMLLEANSDVPGPIMVQILSGPFSGARAIGQFQVMSDSYLVMHFNLVNFKGKDYPVDILALNPDTTLGGIATETDQRYWSRVVLPAAAEFVTGFANGFTQADQNVVIQDGVVISQRASGSLRQGLGQGANEAGQRVSDIINNQASQVKALVKVAAGTPVGLFFTRTVTENTPPTQNKLLNNQRGLNGVNGYNGANNGVNPYGQQGTYPGGGGIPGVNTGYGMTGYDATYSPYAGQNTGTQQGYSYQNGAQSVNNPYAPLNSSSSSTNYGGGITVVPTNGSGTYINR